MMTPVSNGNNPLNQPVSNRLNETRFLARSVSLLALLTGFIYLRVIGLASLARAEQNWPEAILLFALVAAATLGLICAWRWEAVGGIVASLCAAGIALLAFHAFPDHPFFAAFAYSSPFLFSGLLFLACWRRKQDRA
ncbi:MAG: hypothetical protein KC441_09940 [Anaerolineales bacterium]|nr:hypothetical protein [Anaerolineales bacterium]